MNYFLELAPKAFKDMDYIEEAYFNRIEKAIHSLSSVPRPVGVKKLGGSNFWRIRIGAYRVLYKINDAERIVKIERVLHRRKAYRRL